MASKNVMNVANDNNLKGGYPLFLGEDLGFSDEINITYPELDRVYKKQRSLFWLETEFSFEQDRLDISEAPDSERDVMILNLLSQWLLDATASRAIIELFGPVVTNNELHNWFMWQSAFESIHSSTYSKIIQQSCVDSNSVLERGKQNLHVFERCKSIGQAFNDLMVKVSQYNIDSESVSEEDMRKSLLKGVTVLYCLEQISFTSSFASTFALVETGRYQGIGKAVGSILTDEALHAEGDRTVLNIMLEKEGYDEMYAEIKPEIQDIVDGVVQQEMDWSEYIFEEGRQVLGLNTPLLKEYVAWMAQDVYKHLGLSWNEERFGVVPKENPLPFMDKYYDRDSIQAAPQEIEVNNYRVGQVENDLQDEVFDF